MKCFKCGKNRKTHKCVSCKQFFCESHIEYNEDPYQSDINNDHTKIWECETCKEESRNDI